MTDDYSHARQDELGRQWLQKELDAYAQAKQPGNPLYCDYVYANRRFEHGRVFAHKIDMQKAFATIAQKHITHGDILAKSYSDVCAMGGNRDVFFESIAKDLPQLMAQINLWQKRYTRALRKRLCKFGCVVYYAKNDEVYFGMPKSREQHAKVRAMFFDGNSYCGYASKHNKPCVLRYDLSDGVVQYPSEWSIALRQARRQKRSTKK